MDGDVVNGSLMAGRSVGMVTKEEPIASIVNELCQQSDTA
jgi:enoyl-[acyl-carrier protein] reductase II